MIVKPALAAMLATGLIVSEAPKLVFPKPVIVKPENLEFSKHILLGMPLTMGLLPGKAIPNIEITNEGSTSTSATNATSYTFSNYSIGSAYATRRVVVCVSGNSGNTGRSLSSATIGGQSATIHVQRTDNTSGATVVAVISALVTSGTTATIALTFNSGMISAAVRGFAIDNLQSATPVSTGSAAGSRSMSTTVSWEAGGFVVGVANCAVQSSLTWGGGLSSGVTTGVENLSTSVAKDIKTTAASSQSVTVSVGGGTTRETMCVASFR